MKKLLDETTDDLTRALLEAGRSQRPPTGNHAKLLVALGVGAGVGLFSAKASAWLGTSAGKLTLFGVGLSMAGLVWVALPPSEPDRVEARSRAAAASAVSSNAVSSNAVAAVAPSALIEPQPAFVPARVAAAPSDPSGSSLAGSPVSNAVPARHAHAPVAVEWRRRVSGEGRRTAMRRGDTSQRSETNSEGPLSAASAAPPAVGAPPSSNALPATGLSSTGLSSTALSSESPSGGAGLDAPVARAPGLESEIQLVDAMRGAAQRNDTSALQRLLVSYRGTFPEGQLRQEVSELARRRLLPAR